MCSIELLFIKFCVWYTKKLPDLVYEYTFTIACAKTISEDTLIRILYTVPKVSGILVHLERISKQDYL